MDPTLKAVLASWRWRPDVAVVVTALALVYVAGFRRLSRRQGAVRPRQLVLYLGGLTVIALALLSPLDTFGPLLFAAHMIQHELLMMGAAPLLLLANPLPVVLWAIPERLRRRLGRLLAPEAPARRAMRFITWMPVSWTLYFVTLWGWHLPTVYEAALRHEILHNVQHLSFFAAGLVFWWPVVNPAPRIHGHIPYGFRLVYVGAAAGPIAIPVMSIAAFAPAAFYPHYTTVPRLWGLTPLEDQAIGWALMGAFDGAVYLVALLLLVAAMLDREERLTRLRETLEARPGDARP